jgi:hypothetical protein
MPLKAFKNSVTYICVAAFSQVASADLDFLNIQLLEPSDDIVASAEYSYFDISLDFIDFASKVNSSSRPERSYATELSFLAPVSERLRLGYEFKKSSALVSRTVEPFSIKTQGDEHRAIANYHLGYFIDFPMYINLSASVVEQDSVDIDCYAHNGLVLGGTCENADIRLLDGEAYITGGETTYYPAMTINGRAQSYRIGLEIRGELFGGLPFYQKIDYQSSRTEVSYSSKLLEIDDQLLLNSSYRGISFEETITNLSSQLPQQTPWTEQAVIIEFGSKLGVTDKLSASLSLRHYLIDRRDYQYGANETIYKDNTALDLALWYQPSTEIMLYIKGQVSQRNLLGIEPLAYNRKTSKFFEQPYGQIAAGISYWF